MPSSRLHIVELPPKIISDIDICNVLRGHLSPRALSSIADLLADRGRPTTPINLRRGLAGLSELAAAANAELAAQRQIIAPEQGRLVVHRYSANPQLRCKAIALGECLGEQRLLRATCARAFLATMPDL